VKKHYIGEITRVVNRFTSYYPSWRAGILVKNMTSLF